MKEVPGAGFPTWTPAECGAEGLLVGKGDTERPPLLTAFKAADGKGALKNAVAQQVPGVVTADHDRVLHGVCRIIEPVFRGSDGGIDLPGKGQTDDGCQQNRKHAENQNDALFHGGLLSDGEGLFLRFRGSLGVFRGKFLLGLRQNFPLRLGGELRFVKMRE